MIHHLPGRTLVLRPFTEVDITPTYVDWLNDPEVNRYSRRRYVRTTVEDARRFLRTLPPGDTILAIETAIDHRHIGNIQFTRPDVEARHSEIRILIGARSEWGKGYGTEAIYLTTHYLFRECGLYRVHAGSANPSFARVVEKLGWQLEGRWREHFRDGDEMRDYLLYGHLASEFREQPHFQASPRPHNK